MLLYVNYASAQYVNKLKTAKLQIRKFEYFIANNMYIYVGGVLQYRQLYMILYVQCTYIYIILKTVHE